MRINVDSRWICEKCQKRIIEEMNKEIDYKMYLFNQIIEQEKEKHEQ